MVWKIFGGGRTRIPRFGAPPTTSAPLYQERFESGLERAETSLGSGDYLGAKKTLRTLRDLTREAPLGVSGQYAAALKTLEERTEAEGGNVKYAMMMGKATTARERREWGRALDFLYDARDGAYDGKRSDAEKDAIRKLIDDTQIRIKLEDLLKGIRGKRYGYPTENLDEIEEQARTDGVDVSKEISEAREPVLRGALVIARRQLEELKAGKYQRHDLNKTVWEILQNLENAKRYSGLVQGFQMPAEHAELWKEASRLGMEYEVMDAREAWAKGQVNYARSLLEGAKSFAEKAGVSLPADLDLITAAAPAGEESS